MKKPGVGTKMYFVIEHLYYIPSHAAPIEEYSVMEAEVIDFITIGYTEMVLRGISPEGFRTLHYIKLGEIGSTVFYTPAEAAALAQKMTEKYEQTLGWLGAPDIPMRRSWAQLLQPTEE